MKKILAFALFLGTIFTIGLSFVQTSTKSEPSETQVLAKETYPDVRLGGEDEGIHLL